MWGLVVFLIGTAFGVSAAPRMRRGRLHSGGLLIGAVVGVIVALLGGLSQSGLPLGLSGFVLSVVVLTALFVSGVWLGEWIDHRSVGRQGMPE